MRRFSMRLSKVEKQLPSAQVNVTLPGKLKTDLDGYAAYYQHIHGDAIGIRRVIVEIVRNFVESDREFQSWLKRHSNIVIDANGSRTQPTLR
jgi:hypothetical protein